jgi:hypothetical protein
MLLGGVAGQARIPATHGRRTLSKGPPPRVSSSYYTQKEVCVALDPFAGIEDKAVSLDEVMGVAKTDKCIVDRVVEKLDRQGQKNGAADDKNDSS